MFNNIREDIKSVFDRDPAARNVFEIILCYPGLHALWNYRIAHWFWAWACSHCFWWFWNHANADGVRD